MNYEVLKRQNELKQEAPLIDSFNLYRYSELCCKLLHVPPEAFTPISRRVNALSFLRYANSSSTIGQKQKSNPIIEGALAIFMASGTPSFRALPVRVKANF
ncbi:hypothetical protein ACLBWT_15565 [Paenibacillus sp. D51F]